MDNSGTPETTRSDSAGPPGGPDIDAGIREEHADFFERIVRYLNDAMSNDELRDFSTELEADPAKRDTFVRACLTQAAVSEECSTQYEIFRESLVLRQERQRQAELPALKNDRLEAVPSRPRWHRWLAAAAVIALIGIPLAIMLPSHPAAHPPSRVVIPSFATLTSSYHAQWEKGPDGTGALPAQEEMSLSSGWAEITYKTGTKVTLIGPAMFFMDSPTNLLLHTGRLSATVSGKNFVLVTPDARISDLGTEFGVSVLDRTEFAVFTGKVQANALQDATGANARVLTAGDVAGIAADHVVNGAQGAWPQLFPRRLPAGVNSLSLSDLLSGGDGTTTRQGAALDVATGVWTYEGESLPPKSSNGDHNYHRVTQLPAIDGCFVPDGATTVDAVGHVYDFSHTANISYNQLRIGGIVPWLSEDPHRMTAVLNGTDYSRPPHSLVEFHSNKGITLDLEQLRAMHPDVVFGQLRAIVGNSFPKHLGGQLFIAKSGIYVLVDGQVRFQRPQFSNQDPPTSINVPIQAQDHFLTIVVTDGGDGFDGDWVLLADPEITVDATGGSR